MNPTECQCDKPGFCQLMKRRMSKVRHDECKNKPHYFEMFFSEASKVPESQANPESDWDKSPCRHLGEEIETRSCTTCGMKGQPYTVRECAVHGVCSERKRDSRVECCLGCFEYESMVSIPEGTHRPRPS